MKIRSTLVTVVAGVFIIFSAVAGANQADDTTITITGKIPGVTPFLSQLTLQVSNTTVLKSIQFAIDPKPGSVTRPLSGTYSNDYLASLGFVNPPQIILPVYGLYAGYTNTVRLTYRFLDGSSKQAVTSITTTTFDDQGCGYNNPTRLQPRTNSTHLSYDYIFDSSACGNFSPVILDSDGALRWVSPFRSFPALVGASTFFDGAVYVSRGSTLSRVDLDGSVSLVADYSNLGVESLHHNIERGKTGLLIEVDTNAWYESVILEVDSADGHLLKIFNMADIISAAMIAGGDDPSQFVFQRTPQSNNDWFHNNAAAYNRADDSVIISSRENFVICIDYKTRTIKWILGDPTKKWHQFPSLAHFALMLAPGSLPPIGQHAVSVTYDQNLLLFDNGLKSLFPLNQPPGEGRTFSSPRKYSLDLVGKVATEVWNFPMNQSVYSPICSSCYEDAPLNYLIDYASVGVFPPPPGGGILSADYHSVGTGRQAPCNGRFRWIGWRESIGLYYRVDWIVLPVVVYCDESAGRVIHAENRIREHGGKSHAAERWPQRAKHNALGVGPGNDEATDQDVVTARNKSPGRDVERLRPHCRELRIF